MYNQSKTTSSLTSGQTKAKDHLSGWKVGALFMEAGTGKTRVAVEIVRRSPCDACFWIGALNTIRTRDGVPSVKDEVDKWGGMGIPTTYTGIESIQASDRLWLELLDRVKSCRNPFIVVDGFHRTTVIQQDKQVNESLHGYVPVSRLNKSLEDRITATVRHNMARGTHQVELSAKLVTMLKKHNWTNARIGMELGMDADEVLRLKQITGLAEAFKDEEFSRSWI